MNTREVLKQTLFSIDNYDTFLNICKTNKEFRHLCFYYKKQFIKHFLNLYFVDYNNPNNFIYIYNNVSMDSLKYHGNDFFFKSVFNLYLKCYYNKKIYCDNKNISSFPIYPHLEICKINNNSLTFFPIQPNMINCDISYNQLISFFIQPKLKNCIINNNYLSSFDIQPKMKKCIIYNNYLKSFETQPKMTYCDINNNLLKTFQEQPNMLYCNVKNNQLKSFSTQPTMIYCSISNNDTVLKIHKQPSLIELDQ